MQLWKLIFLLGVGINRTLEFIANHIIVFKIPEHSDVSNTTAVYKIIANRNAKTFR